MENKSVEYSGAEEILTNSLQANEETKQKLSDGLLLLYKPHVENVKKSLNELREKQVVLAEQLHDENLKLSWTQNSVELMKIFDLISTYQSKLINIKKDMKVIHEKNLKLKKRAIRLQQHKEKLEYIQNQTKENDLKKEQDLIHH